MPPCMRLTSALSCGVADLQYTLTNGAGPNSAYTGRGGGGGGGAEKGYGS